MILTFEGRGGIVLFLPVPESLDCAVAYAIRFAQMLSAREWTQCYDYFERGNHITKNSSSGLRMRKCSSLLMIGEAGRT